MIAALFAWIAGCSTSTPDFEGAPVSRAGDVEVRARVDPDPPRTEDETVWLELRRGGAPVDAEVVAEAMMPAMGAMPEMRARAELARVGAGVHRGRLDLPMGGGWTLNVVVDGQTAAFRFTVGSPGLTGDDVGQAAPSAPLDLPDRALPEDAVAALREAFAATEQAQALLAADRTDGLAVIGATLADRVERALPATRESAPDVAPWLLEARAAARALARAGELPEARQRFGALNRALFAVASADPRLGSGWYAFRCPMASGFPKWFQSDPELRNPYFGAEMPTCGEGSDWTTLGPVPGRSEAGAVTIDASRRQEFGIRTGPVERRPLTVDVRALGEVRWDESRIEDVVLTIGGFIRHLEVDETGQRVRKGQPLFVLYSPELFAAEQEWLLARQRGPDDPLARAGRQRLELMGLTGPQLDALVASGAPTPETPILSPVGGYVVEKDVVEGSAFSAGQRVFRIAPLSEVWVEASVYSRDVPYVAQGQPATITLPNLPGEVFQANVDLLQPVVGSTEHTRTVRLRLQNADERLLPGMYADVRFQVPLGHRLVVPDSAVLYVGERRIVFVALEGGRLVPREIEVGARGAREFEVVSGLAEGEQIVTSGTFLVAAESRLRSATELWGGDDGSR